LFELLEKDLDAVLALDDTMLSRVILECCELKAMVVSRDECEAGYRSILNFGHTMGHAVEQLTNYKRYLHGEGVSVGMAFAVRFSHDRGLCGGDVVERVLRLLTRAGLPVDLPAGMKSVELAAAVGTDKKMSADRVKFVAVEEIGRCCFQKLSVEEIVRHAEQQCG
jgi:3-dehydroquinate synthase